MIFYRTFALPDSGRIDYNDIMPMPRFILCTKLHKCCNCDFMSSSNKNTHTFTVNNVNFL